MLENWDKVKQYAETGAKSAGTAMEKYGVILEGVEAKQAQLNAKVQDFYTNVFDSGLITGLLDLGKGFMDIINLGDGLVGKILLLVTALTALNFAVKSNALSGFRNILVEVGSAVKEVIMAIPRLIAGLKAQKTAQDAVNTATATGNALTKMNPWLAIAEVAIMAIMGIKMAIDAHNEAIQETIDKANELTETYKSTNQEITDNINSLAQSGSGSYGSLADEFEALCRGVDAYGNNISLTNSEYERYKSICEQIVGLNPKLMDGYQTEAEAIGNKNSLLQETIDLLREQQKEEARQYVEQSDELLAGYSNQYDKNLENAINNGKGVMPYVYQAGRDNDDIGFWDGYDKTDAIKNNLDKILQDTDRYYEEAIAWLESRDYSEDAINTFKENYWSWIDGIEQVRTDYSDDMQDVYIATAKSMDEYYNLDDVSKNFLIQYVTETFKIDENTTQEVIDNNVDKIQEITKALADPEIQNVFKEFSNLDLDSFSYSEYLNQLTSTIDTLAEQTGLDKAILGNILPKGTMGKYTSAIESVVGKFGTALAKAYSGYDFAKEAENIYTLDEITAIGKYQNEVRSYLYNLPLSELDKAGAVINHFVDDAGHLNTTLIDSVDDIDKYISAFDGIEDALGSVSDGFASATQAKNLFEATMDGITEYDDNFNSYASAIKILEEEFEKGTVGSKRFAEATKYLFGEGFDVTNVDEVYERLQTLKKVFGEDTYGEGMLKQIQKLNEAGTDLGETFAKQNSDGTWDFDIDTSEEGIAKLAEALGITEEGVWACIEAMQMLGGVDLFDTEVIEDFAKQFGLLTDLDVEGIDNNVISVDKLQKLLSDAGINTEYLTEALQGLEDKGYVLLDLASPVEELTTKFENLGLIVKDSEGNISANMDAMIESLGAMGYGSDEIANVLSKLTELDNFEFTKTGEDGKQINVETTEAEAKIKALEEDTTKVDSAVDALNQVDLTTFETVINSGADVVNGLNTKLENTVTLLETIDGVRKVEINYTETGDVPDGAGALHGIGNGISHSGRSYLKGTAFGHGNWGAKKDVTALTAEREPEIWVHADTGEWELITNPRFVRVKQGDIIFNGKQTKDLLSKGSSASFGASFLKGTAYASGSSWGKWKKKYGISTTSSSSKSKSKSSSSSKEWWEEELEALQDSLDYSEITLETYIEGLGVLLGQVKKGSEAWKEINKELQEAKLENIENQFDRGEITIDEYISKLTDLRKNYKKNTEEYKELTQTINEAKADNYADQYERGEISLKSYIKQLTKLRDSYKKGSEEWKEYNDLIRECELEDYFDKLTKSVEKYEQAISELGDVNTDKERVKYAQLLSKEYAQTLKNIDSLEKKLADPILTKDEREKVQEELNEALEKEVSIRDEIEGSIREYYENQKEQLEQQAELTKKQTLYNKEVVLYGKQGKELWEYNNNKQIEALEKQVEARNAEKEALDEINEREELENSLLEARLKLQNALNNKTTKILTKQADGTWAYTFSANMADVKSARDEVDSAQKALDDFDWEQETKELEKQIDELNKNAEELASQYEDAEFWANREYEQTINSIAQAYGDIDALVEKWMETYGKNETTFTNAYQKVVKSNNSLTKSITTLTTALEGYYETVGSNGTITPKSFDTGGEIVGSGLILAHDKERVLTQEQNVGWMKLINNIDSANKLVDIAKLNIQGYQKLDTSGVNKDSQTVIHSVSCNFPSITTTDGLQKAILQLPQLALQKK